MTLTPMCIDTNPRGQILFDMLDARTNQHSLKCFTRTKNEEVYNHVLEGPKKMIKFFNSFVIEVKTEKGMDKIQIYDFENKLSVYNNSF